jgi:hypothetical protein
VASRGFQLLKIPFGGISPFQTATTLQALCRKGYPHFFSGLTLGSKLAYGTAAYQHYQCGPSQKFEGFVWCTKPISDKEARGRFKAWFSILHAQDGVVAYVNRYQEPAYWDANEVADDIQRYSRKIGEEPHVIQLPVRPGLPKGTLATWGKVVLEPIVGDELRLLGEDKPLKKGIAIDFIGNFTRLRDKGYRSIVSPGARALFGLPATMRAVAAPSGFRRLMRRRTRPNHYHHPRQLRPPLLPIRWAEWRLRSRHNQHPRQVWQVCLPSMRPPHPRIAARIWTVAPPPAAARPPSPFLPSPPRPVTPMA